MDEELLALWNRLTNPAEGDEALSDEELAQLEAGIRERLATVNRDNPSDEDLAVLAEIRDSLAAVRETIAQRDADNERRRGEAAAMFAEIDPEPQAASGEGGEGEQPPEGGGEGTGEQQPPAEGEQPAPVEVTPAEGQPTTVSPPEGGEGAGTQAAATPPTRMPSITRLAERMPSNERRRPRPAATQRAQLIASADIPGVQAGDVVDLDRWAEGVGRRIEAMMRVRTPGAEGEPVYFGTIRYADQIPEERWLHQSDIAGNDEKLDALTRPEAIAAAGGLCGPLPVDYSVTTIATADRPVRDGMAQFGADRGGLQFTLPHTLMDVTADAPASIWTHTTQANPGGSTKPHAVFSCQAPTSVSVDAVPAIVQFDNFTARYFREQVEQYMATVDAVHARLAEATLLATMVADSTAVNAGNNGTGQTGAASEALAEIDRIVARFRYVHRTPAEYPIHIWYPEWFEDMMRADLARELPGNSGGAAGTGERLAVADAQIDAFFRVRNINTSSFLDSPTGFGTLQGWTGKQPQGDASPWPDKVLFLVSHEGAWQFLDGGELNLGMVRDSGLNAVNAFQFFMETFEAAAFRGHESLAVTMNLCPDGSRAAATDTSTLCSTGS